MRRYLEQLADDLERLLWDAQDRRMIRDGFEVTRLGRWRRAYRHPALVDAALARRDDAEMVPEVAA